MVHFYVTFFYASEPPMECTAAKDILSLVKCWQNIQKLFSSQTCIAT